MESLAKGVILLALLLPAALYLCSAQETGYPTLPPAPSTTPWAPQWSPEGKWIAKMHSIVLVSKLRIYRDGVIFREVPIGADDHSATFKESVRVSESSWFSLEAEGPPSDLLDAEFPQAATSDGRIRNADSAKYFIRWIEKLRASALEWPWWRSEKEKSHMLAQFAEARAVCEKLAAEAR